tara:strand:- start:1081 stop:1395 length:315 start_codon:yes stop_codon:yes gene_type:complete
MTQFNNKQFNFDGMYLTYGEGRDRRFVARFKNGGLVSFKKFLRDNFTVEEYFAFYDTGMAPLKVLETKGYVSPNAARILKQLGYPVSRVGFDKYLDDQVNRYAA